LALFYYDIRMMENIDSKNKLSEVAKLFLKLGVFAFGGPAAHIAMMEDEVVKKKKWMSHEHFLDLVGITKLIPGPNSSEMAMHCGQERAGWKGLIVAGMCFIVPAVLITLIIAWLYQSYGQLPEVAPFIFGIKPSVIAIVVSALISLGKKALKTIELGILGIITFVVCLFGVNEIVALFGCGAMGVMLYFFKKMKPSANVFIPIATIYALPLSLDNYKIFWIFLKIGSLLYGSGYVLFAFLDAELVAKGFIGRQVIIDSIAVGQFTPGPILSTATFVGWQLNGLWGAIVATIGIFLPSFVLVYFLNPIIPKLRKSKAMSAFLNAVNVASVAIILVVCVEMGKETITDWRSILIALISFIVIFLLKKLNSAFIVLGGSIAGYLLLLI